MGTSTEILIYTLIRAGSDWLLTTESPAELHDNSMRQYAQSYKCELTQVNTHSLAMIPPFIITCVQRRDSQLYK